MSHSHVFVGYNPLPRRPQLTITENTFSAAEASGRVVSTEYIVLSRAAESSAGVMSIVCHNQYEGKVGWNPPC